MRLVLMGILTACFLTSSFAQDPTDGTKKSGGFFDSIFGRKKSTSDGNNKADLSSFSTDQLTGGLKDALEKGLRTAVATLGQTNGFLTNMSVHIRMPDQLRTVENTLRKLHQDALVDEFETSMNRAAEKAVPAGTEVLLNSLKQMSVEDAANLLTSKSPTAITDYFRRTSTNELSAKFLPIVQEATAKTSVTENYKELMSKVNSTLSGFSSFLPKISFDVDQYVTNKTLDGLFVQIGDEEKRIRENPQARTTELLQKVFGAIRKN
jgi:hypothetical protein